jgi:hypothetical protein
MSMDTRVRRATSVIAGEEFQGDKVLKPFSLVYRELPVESIVFVIKLVF